MKKHALRAVAKAGLEEMGYRCRELAAPGVMPGGRLRITRNQESWLVAVRTSSDRALGLLKRPDGVWRTVPKVDMVVLSVPAKQPGFADLFCFRSDSLLVRFDQAVAASHREISDRAPIFLALEEIDVGATAVVAGGLAELAIWTKTVAVPDAELMEREFLRTKIKDLTAELKERLGELTGCSSEDVQIDIRIVL